MAPSTKHFRKREAILTYLRSTDTHPSAEMVFQQLKQDIPDLSLGTVYRNLSMFKQQGTIAGIAVVDGVERFDGNIVPHVHFICEDCGSVLDLKDMEMPEALYEAVRQRIGGTVAGCQLSFTGKCRVCLEIHEKGGESA